jgi:hypothetical protein
MGRKRIHEALLAGLLLFVGFLAGKYGSPESRAEAQLRKLGGDSCETGTSWIAVSIPQGGAAVLKDTNPPTVSGAFAYVVKADGSVIRASVRRP